MSIYRLGTRALRSLDPETAHRTTIRLLKAGLGPSRRGDAWSSLRTEVAGVPFPNPLGLAAGFDKNAEAPDACLGMGFGFVEVGAVTPKGQPGNPRPRVFRLPKDGAVINRYGFNNDGLDAIGARLRSRQGRGGLVGVNLGANKDSEDRAADFVTCARALSPHVAFCTVNVSSPNTPGLRSLQDSTVLSGLLADVREAMVPGCRLFLKIAPDLTEEDCQDLCALVRTAPVDALVISNTTIGERDRLSTAAPPQGGLSGRPLFALSNARLAEFARSLGGAVPLIGVGGIFDAEDAWTKIGLGASLLQLYTALSLEGPDLVPRILDGLAARLAAEGVPSIAAAVGHAL